MRKYKNAKSLNLDPINNSHLKHIISLPLLHTTLPKVLLPVHWAVRSSVTIVQGLPLWPFELPIIEQCSWLPLSETHSNCQGIYPQSLLYKEAHLLPSGLAALLMCWVEEMRAWCIATMISSWCHWWLISLWCSFSSSIPPHSTLTVLYSSESVCVVLCEC